MNLTEILKDCPKGTKLYSPALGECALEGVIDNNDYPIQVTYKIINNDTRFDYFTKDGYILLNKPDAECMLFPSKDQRDWGKWHRPFVDGDVVYAKVYNLSYIIIYHKQIDERVYRHVCLCLETNMFGCDKDCIFTDDPIDEWRLATEEEKVKLFNTIKSHGYKWNAEEKKLETILIEPKFKVGNIIKDKCNLKWKVIDVNSHYYEVSLVLTNTSKLLEIKAQDDWKLVPNKFDPKTLRPFDKVLVSCNDEWFCDFFSHYDDAVNKFNCTCTGGCPYDYCIPYNDDTKHLIGKSIEDAPEFYKYWKE